MKTEALKSSSVAGNSLPRGFTIHPGAQKGTTTMKTRGLSRLLDSGTLAVRYLGNDRFEWQTMRIFLTLCMNGGEMPQLELEKQTGLAQSAISRNVAKLGHGLTMDEAGARLIEAYEDPAWRRRKIVRLTARGRELAEKITDLLT
jgi:DNA-binding MarR family transcriptional regulator